MKFTITEDNRDSLVSYFVMHCMGAMMKSNPEKTKALEDHWKEHKEYDISFLVQGVEMDFPDLLNHWEKQVDDMVLRSARKLVEDKFDNLYAITGAIQELSDAVVETAKKTLSKGDIEMCWQLENLVEGRTNQ
jgi:hypothetical protein